MIFHKSPDSLLLSQLAPTVTLTIGALASAIGNRYIHQHRPEGVIARWECDPICHHRGYRMSVKSRNLVKIGIGEGTRIRTDVGLSTIPLVTIRLAHAGNDPDAEREHHNYAEHRPNETEISHGSVSWQTH
jgi:hypothetical protein